MSKTKNEPKQNNSKIVTLTELTAMAGAMKTLPLEMEGGAKVEIQYRKLSPAEDARLSDIVNGVIPPITKGRTPEEDRIDYANGDYVRKKTDAALTARALALYWCCPMFSEAKPGLTVQSEIFVFIQSQLNAALLETIWSSIRDPGFKFAELVNFT